MREYSDTPDNISTNVLFANNAKVTVMIKFLKKAFLIQNYIAITILNYTQLPKLALNNTKYNTEYSRKLEADFEKKNYSICKLYLEYYLCALFFLYCLIKLLQVKIHNTFFQFLSFRS